MHTLLDLARDSAHEIERVAAPLTTYLVGVAVGRGRALGPAAAQVTDAGSAASRLPPAAEARVPATSLERVRRLWVRWALLVVFVAVLGAVFVNLGEWQLDRLDQRRRAQRRDRRQRTGTGPAVRGGLHPSDRRRRPVAAGRDPGTFDAEHQFVVRYRQNGDADGYQVVTPLRTRPAHVLVDRGFVSLPRGTPRSQPPHPHRRPGR